MKIQKKTELRSMIKDSVGTTDQFDVIEVYSDGSWDIMSCSTWSVDNVWRGSLANLACPRPELNEWYNYADTMDRVITVNFQGIEELLPG